MTSVKPLHALGETLGITVDRLIESESVSRLAGTFTVPGHRVAGLTEGLIDELVATYAHAIRLSVKIGDLEEFALHGTYSAQDLAKLTAAAPDTPSYDVVVQLDKHELLHEALQAEEPHALLYVHADALLAALRRGIRWIEHELWPDTKSRLLILVLDSDLDIAGNWLLISGGTNLHEAKAALAGLPPSPNDLIRRSQRREEYIGWDSELSTSLTPWHFAYDQAVANHELVAQLDTLFALLAVLFTCDRARVVANPGGPPRLQAEFRGQEHVAFVPVNQGEPLPNVPTPQRSAVRALLDWCYQSQPTGADELDWLADRLPFVQIRIAQALEGRAESDRFRVFVSGMPEIFEGAQWHWRAFLEGRVSEYMDRVQKLESTVNDAVEHYTERISSLVKSLTETILAAVAVLIGSFVAATLSEPFDATLFRIGALAYAAYVLLFPGLVGLLAERGHAKEIDASFTAQRSRFEEALYSDKVEEIVGSRFSKTRQRFNRWWTAAGSIYAILSIAIAMAATIVPDRVA